MLESIADPIRLRVVRYLDEHDVGSLSELAEVAGVHVNTVRPHVQALEDDGVLGSRQRRARGPGRRVIEYFLREPLTVTDSGTEYALGRFGSRKRRAITDTCAIVKASSAPNA